MKKYMNLLTTNKYLVRITECLCPSKNNMQSGNEFADYIRVQRAMTHMHRSYRVQLLQNYVRNLEDSFDFRGPWIPVAEYFWR